MIIHGCPPAAANRRSCDDKRTSTWLSGQSPHQDVWPFGAAPKAALPLHGDVLYPTIPDEPIELIGNLTGVAFVPTAGTATHQNFELANQTKNAPAAIFSLERSPG